MQLADTGEQVPPGTRLGVVRRALVWVLAVDEVGDLDEARGEGLRERVDVAEPARDRRLVGRGGREGLGSENAAGLAGDVARLAQLGEDRAVALGLHTGATCAKFLAAARSMDGPPMSIISTASSSWTPCREMTCVKG